MIDWGKDFETFLPNLRSVDKGAFLHVREGVGVIILLNFTPEISKIQKLPRDFAPFRTQIQASEKKMYAPYP